MHGCLRYALLVVSLCAAPSSAQDLSPADPARGGPTDPVELEAFVDGLMEVMLQELHSAGAVVSVVKGGEVFFAKGYGFADWEARTPVDPATTLFRIGSVSKLFTWTSVMQMVEAGGLDLNTDVNEYLDFEIPATYPEPVTLADIMAHAGGFEDYIVELFGNEPEDVRPLGELLAEQIPARVRPPGDLSSYSNHATGMAAYMVERAAGVDWITYMEENILQPLGMEHTTFRQPLPQELAAHLSKGYSYSNGTFQEEDFEYVPLAPVGAGSASATDMARFMIGHLQLGRFGDRRFLQDETARAMQTNHHEMAPGVNGMAHGFMDMSRNGQRIIGHGGDTFWFHSNLALFPEHDLGVFVSFNSADGGDAKGPFIEAFVDRYFPVAQVEPTPPQGFESRAERFTGEFRANRFSHTTLGKLGAVGTVTVRTTEEGGLHALGTDWIEVSPLTFEEKFGDRTLVFREDEGGAITHFFLADVPIVAFERAPVPERPLTFFLILGFSLAAVGITLVAPVAGWALRKWYGVQASQMIRVPTVARATLWSAAALFTAGFVSLLIVLRDPTVMALEVPRGLGIALLFPVLATLPTLGSVLSMVHLWRRGEGRLTVRVFYTLATVSFCLLVWQMSVWNLLGWKY